MSLLDDRKDLVVLVADKNIDYGLRGLFRRPAALGIREIAVQSFVHPRRDPGCAREAQQFLRQFTTQFRHALVVFDYVGSGYEGIGADVLAEQVRTALSANGWDDRSEVIVIDPELEIWVFSPSPHVENCLGWQIEGESLRGWLEGRHLWMAGRAKPESPREALDLALRRIGRPRSSSIYECLGGRVSVRGCIDPGFRRLGGVLARWFPADVAR